jgi:hypothetical protein
MLGIRHNTDYGNTELYSETRNIETNTLGWTQCSGVCMARYPPRPSLEVNYPISTFGMCELFTFCHRDELVTLCERLKNALRTQE